MLYTAKIQITLRKTILDPQGKAVEHSLHSLGYNTVSNTRIGKYIEINVEANDETQARTIIDNSCSKLLSNPVMEDYTFTIEKNLIS